MSKIKTEIQANICYTPLVYSRVNKKLGTSMSNSEIEILIADLLSETALVDFVKRGKNFYISNSQRGIRLTVNSYTNRLITVDKL